jgi:hypothetical protein
VWALDAGFTAITDELDLLDDALARAFASASSTWAFLGVREMQKYWWTSGALVSLSCDDPPSLSETACANLRLSYDELALSRGPLVDEVFGYSRGRAYPG